ncbi:MAG: ATP-dependent DNA helicase [Candidatus Brockarchaeota archaeon]|nr:ATP-dependent DNA helicase [Candidatus Brockarchaeota archaeon]MBO3808205.1 ATP-dependent DNA helicase [Candidatus Brockarchaeota archaeon]
MQKPLHQTVEKWAKKYFPYSEFREHQLEAIEFIFRVLTTGRIGLLSSPCGTGKSVSVLTAYLMAREIEEVGKLFILTRTRNELEIYARELKTIAEKTGVILRATLMVSRQEMCPLARGRLEVGRMDYRSFLTYCSRLKKGVSASSCAFYTKVFRDWRPSREAIVFLEEAGVKRVLMPDELYEEASSRGMCPYELTRLAAADSDVIIGNYNHFLIDEARRSIFARGRMQMGSVNIVFDEAHSLPSAASGLLSDEVSTRTFSRAWKEAVEYGFEEKSFIRLFKAFVERLGRKAVKQVGIGENHVLEGDEASLLRALNIPGEKVLETLRKMLEESERIVSMKMDSGKPPVSHLGRIAEFAQRWVSEDSEDTVRYVRVEKDSGGRRIVRIGICSLDVSRATRSLNRVRSAVLMSGTLWDFPYYRDVLGLDERRVAALSLPSPFKRENRLILVDKAVTTKYELREEMIGRIAERLNRIIESVNGRVAVYFPSYELMEKVSERIVINRPIIREDAKTRVREVLKFLRENNSCLALGVARGKISEGVDLTSEGSSLLSAVVIVGLPYPKRSEMHEALLKYYEKKFGEKAFEYASTTPCIVTLAQMAGRLIRSQRDRGVIVIMDSRIYGRVRDKLPQDWREDMHAHLKIENLTREVSSFLS